LAETKKEVYVSGLKPWTIAAAIILPIPFWFGNQIIQALTPWWVFAGVLPFTLIMHFVVFFLLEKVSPRFKISTQSLAVFTVIIFMLAGTHVYETGIPYWTTVPISTYNMAYFIRGLYVDPYKTAFWAQTPPAIVPKNEAIIKAFYEGGAYNFSAWAGPWIFWSLWALAAYGGLYFWSFFMRKPSLDVEKNPFPWAMPSVITLELFDQGRRIFNFGLRITKFFYLGLVVGVLIYLPNAISALSPIPFPIYTFQIPLDLNAYTRGILPGANFSAYFPPIDTMASIFIPMDVLASIVLFWILFGVIWPVIGVRTGILPYTPGVETHAYNSTIAPFKYGTFAILGMSIGMGIWIIWHYRRYWLNIFNVTFKGKPLSGMESDDQGVHYRWIGFGSIGMFLLLAALFLIGGTTPVMAFVIPAIWICYIYGWVWIYQHGVGVFQPAVGTYNGLVFDFGTVLGQWGPRPSPAAFNSMMMYSSFGGGVRMASYGPYGHFVGYKIGDALKTRAKDIWIISLITMISIAFSHQLLWPWFYTRFGGYLKSTAVEYHVWGMPAIWNLTYGTPPEIGTAETWAYVIGGTALVFVVSFLRARFAWFFLHPVGMYSGFLLHWGVGLPAFVIKYVTLKVGGAKAYNEGLAPLAAGMTMGCGTLFILVAWVEFFNVGLPTLIARI